jgi:DNA-binding transcriptional ArsR family regulator
MAATASSTQDLFVALGHPTRRRILRLMLGGPPASPRELSEQLHDSLSNVSYHFRVMAAAGVLELVDTRPVRGSTQHFYGISLEAGWARAVLALEEPPDARGPRGEDFG